MTFGTIGRELIRSMVRIVGAIVVRHMARVAFRRGTSVPVRVALDAACARMLAGQGEAGVVMVKGGRNPGRGIVTLRTIRWESGLHVAGRRGCIVVGDVAGCTVRGRPYEAVGMALHAIHCGV